MAVLKGGGLFQTAAASKRKGEGTARETRRGTPSQEEQIVGVFLKERDC